MAKKQSAKIAKKHDGVIDKFLPSYEQLLIRLQSQTTILGSCMWLPFFTLKHWQNKKET